ncbi:MAG TPA: pentapeptide repeat-containing protein [Saprospiraceae bacterium]|nr:pentapeptide repeat-containing protein [Saprospiraceae bacterium]
MKGNRNFFIGFLLGILLAGAIFFLFLLPYFKKAAEDRQKLLLQESLKMESQQESSYAPLLKNVIDKINHDVQQDPNRTLSDETIDMIAAMCQQFQPYFHPPGDTVLNKKLSPERGRLLLLLALTKIDSVSFMKVKEKTDFSYVDLRQVDLHGIDLSGIQLHHAELKDANLEGAKLNDADLSFANLWGAKLTNAQLIGSNLRRAELSWADLSGADLRIVNLHEANLVSAQLRGANLHGVDCVWTDFTGAFLNGATMAEAKLFRTIFRKAQLEKTDFSGSKMTYAVMTDANLNYTNLTNSDLGNLIVADPDWLNLLDTWHVMGASDIRSKYKQIEAFNYYRDSKYQLVLK